MTVIDLPLRVIESRILRDRYSGNGHDVKIVSRKIIAEGNLEVVYNYSFNGNPKYTRDVIITSGLIATLL